MYTSKPACIIYIYSLHSQLFEKIYSTFLPGVFTLFFIKSDQFMFQYFVIVSVFVLVFFFGLLCDRLRKCAILPQVFFIGLKLGRRAMNGYC